MSIPLNERIQRVNGILSYANRSFYISKDLSSPSFDDVVSHDEFLRFSRSVHLKMCVIELAKLFQKRENTQKQNLHTLLDSLEPNQHGITEIEIEKWKNELNSIDKKVTEKIDDWRDGIIVHTDDDYLKRVEKSPLSLKEIELLLGTAIIIVSGINDKIRESGRMNMADLEFEGSLTELQCGGEFLRKYKELLEIEKKSFNDG